MVKEFENLVENCGIPSAILQKIENDISDGNSRQVRLTALQKEVINHPNFWSSSGGSTNVIVQGATSSGKTLVAELLALESVFAMHKHVVYLVPLKALVSEKVQQFKKDIYGAERRMRINIFASSSDYQDHDTELAEGQYDIAVVVYEKFFAMLAEQKDNKFLEKCGLIVVDEIQLLNSQDRGAKLEFSLTKVKNNYQNAIRILGLTTVDCDTNYINQWLNAEIIKNFQRPIGLKETVISLNGLYWERQVYGEDDGKSAEAVSDRTEGQITIEGFEKLKNQTIDVKRTALLSSLLRKINEEDSGKKIIVFASNRERCKRIARNIARSNVFGRITVNEQLNRELNKTDDESEKLLLQNELLPYGIAYHNAALSMSLRELIESEFKNNNGSIRLLVATETITIGMNLPADVMILFDNKVYRGSDGAVDIRPQEYKNYIGRAGRLGITDKIGESYLFVNTDSEIQYYWSQYVNCKIEEVSSALRSAEPRECAPYFLNLLCKGKEEVFSEQTIKALAEKTLNASEAFIQGKQYSIDTSKIIKDFKKVELIREMGTVEDELDEEENAVTYKLTNFGEMLAPYALSVKSCFRIKKYFRDEGNKTGKGGGLPLVYSAKDLKNDQYLLDILFTVCKMEEVRRISQPRLPEPKNPHNRLLYQMFEKAILDYLRQYKEREGAQAFWDDSEVERIIFDDEEIETEQLNAALRAILLLHWIKGELPSQMKEHTGLSTKEFTLYTGDMARIGESCSYVVEAISKCLFTNAKRTDDGRLEHAFYSLSVKLKYGLSNSNLIQVANRHIYGLSRSTIIQMDKAAQSSGFENVNLFIRSSGKKVLEYLTMAQRRDLIQQMSERYDDRNVENLIAKLIEDEIVDFSLETDYKTIAHPRQLNEWLESLKNVFASLEGVGYVPLQTGNGIKLQWKDRKLCLILLFDKPELSSEMSEKYRKQLKVDKSEKIVYLYDRDTAYETENQYDILISAEYVSKIILEFLALSGYTNSISISICNYLYEQEGPVADKGTSALQKSIEKVLEKNDTMDSDAEQDLRSPYEQFLCKNKYKDIGSIQKPYGHAVIHKVQDRHEIDTYVVKEIRIPENQEEFCYLEKKTDELCQMHDCRTDDEIKQLIQECCTMKLADEDLNNIIQLVRQREMQLASGTDKKRQIMQSIVFLSEGYKRLNEARNAAALKSSHIVHVFNPEIYHVDYEDPSLSYIDTEFNKLCSVLFFVMDAYDGNVYDKRKELAGNEEEIICIGVQVCEALIVCHDKGILHRDIKPVNILYRNKNEYGLCDFGCAVRISEGKTLGVGTKEFMPPEAFHSGIYTEQSDFYSLGKTLQYLYTYPSEKNSYKHQEASLLEVLDKAVANNPSDRYESAEAFKMALENVSITNVTEIKPEREGRWER